MILNTVNQSITVVLAGAVTTSQLIWSTAYADHTATTFSGAGSNGLTNGTTAVTMVAAPAASSYRQLKYLTIFNADTVSATVTVSLVDTANIRRLTTISLAVGETLEWTPDKGFHKPYQVTTVTGPVASVFGRTGTVVALAGDYTAAQVTNVPAGNISATTVQAAINELDTEKGTVFSVNGASSASGFTITGGPITTTGTLTFNISDAALARTSLGLGTFAVQNTASLSANIIPDTDNSRDLGSMSNRFANIYAVQEYVGYGTQVTSRFSTFPVTAALQIAESGSRASLMMARFSADNTAPRIYFLKTRGTTVNDFAATISGDILGQFSFAGADGTQACEAARIGAVQTGTPGATFTPAELQFNTTNGTSNTVTATMTADGHVSIRAGGIWTGSFTIASLPTASLFPRLIVYCSNLGGGAGYVQSNGTSWERLKKDGYALRGTGASITLTYLTDAETQLVTAAFTANRVWTLASGAPAGAEFKITRAASSTGAFTLDLTANAVVLKSLTPGTWARVVSNGTDFYLAEYGSL